MIKRFTILKHCVPLQKQKQIVKMYYDTLNKFKPDGNNTMRAHDMINKFSSDEFILNLSKNSTHLTILNYFNKNATGHCTNIVNPMSLISIGNSCCIDINHNTLRMDSGDVLVFNESIPLANIAVKNIQENNYMKFTLNLIFGRY